MDEVTVELTKLAGELETVKLLGMLLFIALAGIVLLVGIFSRNVQSQDKTNEQSVEASFTIIGKLIDRLEPMVQNTSNISKELIQVSMVLTSINQRLISLHDKHDAVLLLLVPTNSAQAGVVETSAKNAEG